MKLIRRGCRLVLRVEEVFLEEDSVALFVYLGFLEMVASLIAEDLHFERVLSAEMGRQCVVSLSVVSLLAVSLLVVSLLVVSLLFGVLGGVLGQVDYWVVDELLWRGFYVRKWGFCRGDRLQFRPGYERI